MVPKFENVGDNPQIFRLRRANFLWFQRFCTVYTLKIFSLRRANFLWFQRFCIVYTLKIFRLRRAIFHWSQRFCLAEILYIFLRPLLHRPLIFVAHHLARRRRIFLGICAIISRVCAINIKGLCNNIKGLCNEFQGSVQRISRFLGVINFMDLIRFPVENCGPN